MIDPPSRQRLFFALFPGEAFRTALTSLAKKLLHKRGKRVSPENLHLTLAFLGSTDPEQRRGAEAVAGELSIDPFVLTFDRLGHWPRQRVLWSAPSEVPEGLLSLVSGLNDGLRRCGFIPDARPYRVHLTVARKVAGSLSDMPHEPLIWPVQAFHLVESETRPEGARYQIIGTWPLRGASHSLS